MPPKSALPLPRTLQVTLRAHFSHPFLGTYEVIQFLELANLEGTPFQSGMTSIPIPSYHGMETTYHTISYHTIPSHTIPYHTIPLIPFHSYHTIPFHSYHTIPCHTIPSFQPCHRVSGVLFTKFENYFCRLQYWSIGLHLLWTGSSDFCCHFKLQVEAMW
jgi:hypothetical protein